MIQLSRNKAYKSWVKELTKRYLTARLKASVEVTRTLLEYYWSNSFHTYKDTKTEYNKFKYGRRLKM